jgi:protease IV
VIISMGNYAASGGYYISAPATRIYADSATISGSIGVFGLLPNAGKLLEQKLGLSTEVVNTNKNSDFPSVFRPMNSYEKEVMQSSVEKTYNDFVTKVATGRSMSFESIDSIGQGRVWSGTRAKEIGLVDEFGGLNDAIKGAAVLANVDKYSLRELPEIEDPYTRLLSQLGGEIKLRILKNELGESVKYFKMVEEIRDLSGIQARLPYFLEIR